MFNPRQRIFLYVSSRSQRFAPLKFEQEPHQVFLLLIVPWVALIQLVHALKVLLYFLLLDLRHQILRFAPTDLHPWVDPRRFLLLTPDSLFGRSNSICVLPLYLFVVGMFQVLLLTVVVLALLLQDPLVLYVFNNVDLPQLILLYFS